MFVRFDRSLPVRPIVAPGDSCCTNRKLVDSPALGLRLSISTARHVEASMRGKFVAGSVVAGLALLMAPTGASAVSGTTYYIGSVGDLDPDLEYTPAQVESIDAAARAETAPGTVTEGAGESAGLVEASTTPTPNGFKLYNPGNRTTAYIYNSSKWRVNHLRCNTSCTVIDQWDHQMKEYLNGGSSKAWIITTNAYRVKGSSSTAFSFAYYCGVDVNNGSDYLCNFTNSDHSDSGPINPGDTHYYRFGSAGTRHVFPMVSITALFSSGVRVTTPFRGWDACAGSFTMLCTKATY